MARRLPIYFVLDVSESMVGEPLSQMESVVDHVLTDLRRDPHALESVWFSEIVFAARPKTLTPLQEITSFNRTPLPIGGGTGIGAMLQHLMRTLDNDRRLEGSTGKSDWKPIVYLMTDGRSTDSTDNEVARWVAKYKEKCLLIAISIGTKSDFNLLRKLSDNVVVFMDSKPDSYSRFAKWISRSVGESIRVASSSINSGQKPIASFEAGLVESGETIQSSDHAHDQHSLAIPARCQRTKKPYLLRFDSGQTPKFGSEEISFQGLTPLSETYFELSSLSSSSMKVDVQRLEYPGPCVYCKGEHSIVICTDCSKISCGTNGQDWQCPWCGLSGSVSALQGPGYTERGLG